jgi:hypothetical protein
VLRFAVAALFALPLFAEPRWFKGNTHTHTNASDGDASPSEVVAWYRDHGYDFLVITDHDRVTEVHDDKLLLIPGEEVTDRLPKKPLHVNGIGVTKPVKPQHGTTVVEVLQHDIDAVREAGGIAAVNHPNFGWAFGEAELEQLKGTPLLLEIASGHPFVNMQGGGGVDSVETMWNDLLAKGRHVFAIAVDDSHHYHCEPPKGEQLAPPGRGWIMVRAETLTQKDVVAAIARGDFYASTGVVLEAIEFDGRDLRVNVHEEHGAKYRTSIVRGNGFVRARVDDSNGHSAWTQAFYLSRTTLPSNE